ncbi:MAG: hypothetical protein ACKVOE_04760 [Rickettsiales bacterium]
MMTRTLPVDSGKKHRPAQVSDTTPEPDSLTKRIYKAVMDSLRAELGDDHLVKVERDETKKFVALKFLKRLRFRVTKAVNRALKFFSSAQFDPNTGVIKVYA